MKTNYKLIDDIGLLELIRDQDDDQAYKEFVNRFLPGVKEECVNKCKLRNVDKHVGEQISHETFEKVRKSKSFDPNRLNGSDTRKAINGWLYRISLNLFYDYHNSQKPDQAIPESYFDELLVHGERADAKTLADQRDFTKKILGCLTEKEREVIITDYEWKRSKKYLPRDINASLAERIGVKKESVRKIRERAIKKIKKAIDDFNQKG